DLRLGIESEGLERVKWHDTPFGSSLESPGTPGPFFSIFAILPGGGGDFNRTIPLFRWAISPAVDLVRMPGPGHPVQIDRELARDGDCRLSEPISLGDPTRRLFRPKRC